MSTKKIIPKEQAKVVETKASLPETKCYKFNWNRNIGWTVYSKGECIHLTEEQYQEFKEYVCVCNWQWGDGKKPCAKC